MHLNKPPPGWSNKLVKKASAHLMKNTKWFGLVASLAFPLLSGYAQAPEASGRGAPAQAQAAAPANLSPGAAEVVRLAGSGVGDDVVLAYIQNSQAPFNLAANDVLYLKDIGLSPQVTSAMLSHDTKLRNQPQQYAPTVPAPTTPPPETPADTAPTEAPPPATAPTLTEVSNAPADVNYFYDDLAPYGTWVSLEGLGLCWQPRAAALSHNWRPYCDGGHWVYSDAGWYWQSDYSWGWAPFHYGRWHLHPSCGWVWLPDRAWGPAWVTWRVAGDNCGWAPLPPHAEFDVRLGWRFKGVTVGANFDFGLGANAFAFVALGDFCQHDLGRRSLPPARARTVFRQAAVLNNFVVQDRIIVNRGIALERVSAASRVPIPRVAIRDWPAGPGRLPSPTGAVVYRPLLKAPPGPVKVIVPRLDPRHPVIPHLPIAPLKVVGPPAVERGVLAPGVAPRRPALETPKVVSPWSPAPAPLRVPVPAERPALVPSRPLDTWKQGTRSAPGYRSDTGLPALNNARTAGPPPPAATQTPSEGRNPRAYQPKSQQQAAEIRSVPKSDQRPSDSPSFSGKSSDSKSGNKQ